MKTKPTYLIKLLFSGVFMVSFFFASAGEVKAQSEEKIYENVDEMPIPPGGMDGLIDYFVNNLKYPKKAKKENVQGVVMVTFLVDKEGNVTNPEILRGIGIGCDEEALRAVKGMEAWTAGKVDGKRVVTRLQLPVKFAL